MKKLILLISNKGYDISAKALERRIALAKKRHPYAEIRIRIVNR